MSNTLTDVLKVGARPHTWTFPRCTQKAENMLTNASEFGPGQSALDASGDVVDATYDSSWPTENAGADMSQNTARTPVTKKTQYTGSTNAVGTNPGVLNKCVGNVKRPNNTVETFHYQLLF